MLVERREKMTKNWTLRDDELWDAAFVCIMYWCTCKEACVQCVRVIGTFY